MIGFPQAILVLFHQPERLPARLAGITVTPGSNPLMDVTATTSDDVGVTAVRMVARYKWTMGRNRTPGYSAGSARPV